MCIFLSLLGILLIATNLGYVFLQARVLKSKYKLRIVYRSSSIWLGIKHFYDTILEFTYWIVGTGNFISFWNDKWCSTTSLANIVRLFDGASILDTISQFWTSCDWNIPLSLQQRPHCFKHIMVR